MRGYALAVLGAVTLASAAHAGNGDLVEQGYERGALAVAAIDRGDWTAAERNLMRMNKVAADDPARLINLGRVYMETGRQGQALSAWRLALTSDKHFEVELGDGSFASTREVAQRLLDGHATNVQSAGLQD